MSKFCKDHLDSGSKRKADMELYRKYEYQQRATNVALCWPHIKQSLLDGATLRT
jgi:hypothetical protein